MKKLEAYPIAGRKLMGKVLLVEDDLKLGTWLSTKLSHAGMTVLHVSTFDDAIAAIDREVFHALVTDIFLESGPQGIEILKRIESIGTPVIVISSAADLKIAKEALNHGASYLLEKPFEPDELIKILENIWEEPKGLHSMIERFLDIHQLTPKEKEVVRLILKGLSNKEVASIGGNTDRTIKFHLTSIFSKCGVKSRTELFNAIFPS